MKPETLRLVREYLERETGNNFSVLQIDFFYYDQNALVTISKSGWLQKTVPYLRVLSPELIDLIMKKLKTLRDTRGMFLQVEPDAMRLLQRGSETNGFKSVWAIEI